MPGRESDPGPDPGPDPDLDLDPDSEPESDEPGDDGAASLRCQKNLFGSMRYFGRGVWLACARCT